MNGTGFLIYEAPYLYSQDTPSASQARQLPQRGSQGCSTSNLLKETGRHPLNHLRYLCFFFRFFPPAERKSRAPVARMQSMISTISTPKMLLPSVAAGR